jgi:hypothetical protein
VLRGLRLAGVTVTGVAAAGALAAVAALGGPWAQGWTGDEARALAAGTRAVAVDPAAETLVCPPPAQLPEGVDVGDEQFSAAPVETRTGLAAGVLGGAGPAGLAGLDGAPPGGGEPVELAAGAVSALHADVAATTALHAQPATDAPFRAAGALASITTDGDLRGLAAARCTTPATSHWLVGGSTDVGSSARLTVQNPSPRPATVTLEVFGPGGVVALGGKGSFAVAPGQEVSTRLESVAPEQERLVVHVRAAGARVTASLQTQAIDGLLPAGTELVAPGAAPAPTVAVAGVTSAGEAVDDPRAPRLRLLAPGEQPGAANVSLYGPDGRVTLRGAEQVALEPGVVTDVPLGGLPEGAYTVVVDADVPVVAAGIVVVPGELPEDSVLGGTPHDVAWSPGQPVHEAATGADGAVVAPPAALGQLAVPAGVRADVVLQAVPAERVPDAEPAGTTTVTLRAYGADGAELGSTEVELVAGTSAVVPGADLAGEDREPALVVADRTGGDPLGVVWAATFTADDGTDSPGTLRSVVVPTPARSTPGDVTVRQVDAGR